jgi:uncharacterized protein (TIGR00299 family) protein
MVVDADIEVSRAVCGKIACNSVKVIPRGSSPSVPGDIIEKIGGAGLDAEVAENSVAVFRLLADAEGAVHGKSPDEVHFHEVADSIADVVGTCSAVRRLGVERVYCTPVGVGGGTVDTAHGLLPVPAPATMEILRRGSLTWRGGPSEHELLTPTAAALLSHLVTHPVDFMPPMRIESVGYGCGSHDTPHPNLLRAVLGDIEPEHSGDIVAVLETNIDHAGGEVIAHAAERLFENGALDVTMAPVTMKKGRPGVIVTVISPPDRARELARLLMDETGTLGVRLREQGRVVADREELKVEVELEGRQFEIGVKVARGIDGGLIDVSAEYDDCRRAALAGGITLREVVRLAEDKAKSIVYR